MANKVALIAAFVLLVAVASAMKDTDKCKMDPGMRTHYEECHMEVFKAPAAEPDQVETASPEDVGKLAMCFAKKEGHLNADGTAIDWTKAVASIDKLQADAAIKAAIKTGVEACVTKGGDTAAIIHCKREVFATNCK